jgi:hypothetical protein
MATQKKHDRKLGLCGASLTKARLNQHSNAAMGDVQNEVETLMMESGYLARAPFEWVTVSLRYGLVNEDIPHYHRINKKYGDLPLAIEIDTHDLKCADQDQIKRLFMIATLKALVHAGHKFKLATETLERSLRELSSS